MTKFIKESYLFLILFLILLLEEPIYKIIKLEYNDCNDTSYNLLKNNYNKLLEFHNIDYIYESDYINTLIIYKDIYNYMNEITIRGGKDKAFADNLVIYNNTLVGVINKVNKNSSTVKLITNKDSRISVKINDEVGILEYKNGELIVSNISNYSNVSIGDLIYTSGLGKTKENIYIGQVKDFKLNNKEIEKIITVDYELDIKDIIYVTVIKEKL